VADDDAPSKAEWRGLATALFAELRRLRPSDRGCPSGDGEGRERVGAARGPILCLRPFVEAGNDPLSPTVVPAYWSCRLSVSPGVPISTPAKSTA
jgi:hypothetical protein